jgi:hypothetical protein
MVRRKYRTQAGRALMVVGTLSAAAGVVVPWGYALHQRWGAISAAVAWATCVVAGLMAQGLVWVRRAADGHGTYALWGMIARMGIPLLACLLVYWRGGPLAQAGFVYYLLAFYFVTLIVQTVMHLGDASPQATGKPMV